MPQVRRAFGLGFEEITQLAGEEAAGCEGANFLPFLTGVRANLQQRNPLHSSHTHAQRST